MEKRKMINEVFKVKAYTKSELALAYFPDAESCHTAVNHLMAWIHRNQGLMALLIEMSYSKTAKCFTPRMVRAIVEHLGEHVPPAP